MRSPLYEYVKNQVLLGEFTAENLVTLQERGIITNEERLELTELIPVK